MILPEENSGMIVQTKKGYIDRIGILIVIIIVDSQVIFQNVVLILTFNLAEWKYVYKDDIDTSI